MTIANHNLSQSKSVSNFVEFNPQKYFAEYFPDPMIQDEKLLLEFLIEYLKKLPTTSLALDFGCGPVVSHLIPLVTKAQEIHAADFTSIYRTEIENWAAKKSNAHDWSLYTSETLKIEGFLDPTKEEIEQRENLVRKKLKKILSCDITKPDPMGLEARGLYQLVTSHYCVEALGVDLPTWRIYMRNLMSLVAPGGTLILSFIGTMFPSESANFYRVGSEYFTNTNVTPTTITSCLIENGFVDFDLQVRKLNTVTNQGYDCTMFVCAIKP